MSVIRDGQVFRPRRNDALEPGDCVLIVAPPEQSEAIDQLFAGAAQLGCDSGLFGEFSFRGEVEVGRVADFYGPEIAPEERAMPLGVLVARRLSRAPVIGDRLTIGSVEFVVENVDGDTVTRVGIEPAPEKRPRFPLQRLRAWLCGLARRPAGSTDSGAPVSMVRARRTARRCARGFPPTRAAPSTAGAPSDP